MNYFCCDCTNKFSFILRIIFQWYCELLFQCVLRIIFSLGRELIFGGIANLFFVLQYIAVLAVHFENFASGGAFVKRIPRRNIFGERNDRGFHLFLRNLKGVLSSMQN